MIVAFVFVNIVTVRPAVGLFWLCIDFKLMMRFGSSQKKEAGLLYCLKMGVNGRQSSRATTTTTTTISVGKKKTTLFLIRQPVKKPLGGILTSTIYYI
jgi:hypothetical protein